MEHEPKISTAEAMLWVLVCIIADIISIVPIINWIVWIIMFPATWMYFKSKGVQSQTALVGSIIEVIPVLSILPGYTVEMLVAIYMDRHPKGQLAKVASIASVANIKNPKRTLPTTPPKA